MDFGDFSNRETAHDINNIFLKRWSPRAMSGESITQEELNTLFEAARWAPSSFNEQPWRFLYATRNSPHWDLFFNLMGEFNQSWAKNAAVLVLIISKKQFSRNGNENVVHQFDAGSAWENLALQGSTMNLVVHGMAGFDYEKARTDLQVPQEFSVLAMFAVGKPGPLEVIPEDLREGEMPSGRKPIQEFIQEGPFNQRLK